MEEWQMNNKKERIWKQAVLAYSILATAWGAGKNHE
jgi:hypothetical protein